MGHSLFIIATADCCFRNLENPGCTNVFFINFVASFQNWQFSTSKNYVRKGWFIHYSL